MPGPACYGKGGEATVTDAQIVLGRLDPEQFLGGDIEIDAAPSYKMIEKRIAEPLGLSIENAALCILKIINNNMALAINASSIVKGIDPRNFTLMGFGGAGPLHSVSLAEAIHAEDVVSPVQPGITAATGLLVTDLQYEYTLTKHANRQLDADGVAERSRRFQRVAECRYVGQGFELRAAMPDGTISKKNVVTITDSFFEEHKKVYGHAFRN